MKEYDAISVVALREFNIQNDRLKTTRNRVFYLPVHYHNNCEVHDIMIIVDIC
uniref:Uncharacterized protein n=1 Tax=Heterorhabditis bacteriophora TaxID=37862 RepID=A0A1I7WS47_HETBA